MAPDIGLSTLSTRFNRTEYNIFHAWAPLIRWGFIFDLATKDFTFFLFGSIWFYSHSNEFEHLIHRLILRLLHGSWRLHLQASTSCFHFILYTKTSRFASRDSMSSETRFKSRKSKRETLQSFEIIREWFCSTNPRDDWLIQLCVYLTNFLVICKHNISLFYWRHNTANNDNKASYKPKVSVTDEMHWKIEEK